MEPYLGKVGEADSDLEGVVFGKEFREVFFI
jgi:hypothetical protein